MSWPSTLWLAALLSPPLLIAVLGGTAIAVERLRWLAVASALASMMAAALIFVVPELAGLRVPWPWAVPAAFGGDALRVTSLSGPLLVLPTALWLVTVAVTPRARLDRAGLQRTGLSTVVATLAFLTESPAALAVLWVGSIWLFRGALSAPQHRRARRTVGAYLWVSAALLCAGIVLSAHGAGAGTQEAGRGLIVAAVLIRKGVFPGHAWIPEAFETGRLGPVVLFSAPQLGAYTAAVLVVPGASPQLLRIVAMLSLVTVIYGAALALVQRDARRACGYLFVSQSALVLAGLDCGSAEALAGSLVVWLSSALAFTGMARTILVLEARRGRLDLSKFYGGYDDMPLLAVSFLVLGLACTGFPGTLGFVGQEMLIDGAVRDFPVLGFLVVAGSALTGLAVLRMYFSLFCGARSSALGLGPKRREAVTFSAVAAVLVGFGLAPKPIVASRMRASEGLLEQRAAMARSSSPTASAPAPWLPSASRGRR